MSESFSVLEHELLMPVGHSFFRNCHASTVVALPSGDLLCAFFAGSREGNPDTTITLCSKRDGHWTPPVRPFANTGVAQWNPVLHAEGERCWIFFKVGATVQNWTTYISESGDGGRSWSEPRVLVPGDSSPRGPIKNKPIVLSNGAWLAPGSVEREPLWDAYVDSSPDSGATWSRSFVPLEHRTEPSSRNEPLWEGLQSEALWENDLNRVFSWDGVIQPTLWESAPGCVHMLLRSTRGRIYRSDSTDYGKTWASAYPTSLPNNNCGIDLAKMPSGRLVLAFNPISQNWGRRSPLSVAYSDDNGESWSAPFHLETEPGEYSYPAIIVHGTEIHVTYTWKRINVAHAHLSIR